MQPGPLLRAFAITLALTGCERDGAGSAETSDEQPGHRRTSEPAASASAAPVLEVMPWGEGMRLGTEGGIFVTADWITENRDAGALFLGIEGCRASRGLGPDRSSTYGLSLESKTADEVIELARDRMRTIVPGATQFVPIPGGARGRDARLVIDGVELAVHIAPASDTPRDASWQKGPLAWLADLERDLKTRSDTVTITFTRIGGALRSTAAIEYAFAPTPGADQYATSWARSARFAPDESTGGWTRQRGAWLHTLLTTPDRMYITVTDILDPAAKPSGKACTRPDATLEGKTGAVSVGGPGLAGGGIANAAAVVARMKGRFRACYQHGLKAHPDLQGSVTLVAKIDATGAVTSVAGGSGPLDPIGACLRSVVQSGTFAKPDNGVGATISIPITFVLQ